VFGVGAVFGVDVSVLFNKNETITGITSSIFSSFSSRSKILEIIVELDKNLSSFFSKYASIS
jgi:hypothetical protein